MIHLNNLKVAMLLILNGMMFLFLLSCTPDYDLPDDSDDCDYIRCDTSDRDLNIDTNWTNLVFGRNDNGFENFFINYGLEVTSYGVLSNFNDYSDDGGLKLFDIETGEEIWGWNHEFYFPSFQYHESSKVAILQNRTDIYVIDVTDGSIRNEFHQQTGTYGSVRGQLIGDYYYYARLNEQESTGWIVKTHISDFNNWEKIYKLEQSEVEGAWLGINSYNSWTDPTNSNEILVFQHRLARPNRIDLIALDMTTDSVIWKHEDIEPNGNSSVNQIFINDDLAYFQGGNTIYCIDIPTGEILWQKRFLNPLRSFLHGAIVYADHEDLIIVKDDGTTLSAYKPETGELVWENSDLPHNGVDITYHEGVVYFASGELVAVDSKTGEVIWLKDAELVPGSSTFHGPIAIDQKDKNLITTDDFYLISMPLDQE